MCKWSGVFGAYDLQYPCQVSIMYDWKGDIGRFSKGKYGHSKNHFIKCIWIRFHHQSNPLKDIFIALYLLTLQLDTDGYMD